MSIKADTKYNGIVAPGSQLYETQTGTLGYQVMLECPDRPTSFAIWLTQRNRKRARKYFEVDGGIYCRGRHVRGAANPDRGGIGAGLRREGDGGRPETLDHHDVL